jgi:hypothetical protein
MRMGRAVRAASFVLAMAAALAPAFARAQALSPERALDLHLGRLIVGLVICVALAIAAAVLLKRASTTRVGVRGPFRLWPPGAAGVGVNVLETRRISIHADVCRLSYAGREYVVIVSPGGATLLTEGALSGGEQGP